MALQDLEGKRTGRPRGAKTTSPVRKDILWAYRNLDKPDAKPPSPGARMWADLARNEPSRFLAHLARIEAARQEKSRTGKRGRRTDSAPRGFGDGRSRYEEMPGTHHDHLIDLQSGRVIEFRNDEIEKLQHFVAEQLGYDLVGHRLELYAVPRKRGPE